MLKAEKEKVIQELVEKFQRAQGIYLADYMGLDVETITTLRRKLRSVNVEFLVVKNTLAKLAADQAGISGLDDFLSGPTSLALGYTDAIEPARVLVQFAREHERPKIRSGLLEGQLLTAEQVIDVAALPSRMELLTKIATLAQSPLVGFVYRCQGLIQKVVATLEAYRLKREEQSPAGEAVREEGTQEETAAAGEPDREVTPGEAPVSAERAEAGEQASEEAPEQQEEETEAKQDEEKTDKASEERTEG